jgi:hypothetical protein
MGESHSLRTRIHRAPHTSHRHEIHLRLPRDTLSRTSRHGHYEEKSLLIQPHSTASDKPSTKTPTSSPNSRTNHSMHAHRRTRALLTSIPPLPPISTPIKTTLLSLYSRQTPTWSLSFSKKKAIDTITLPIASSTCARRSYVLQIRISRISSRLLMIRAMIGFRRMGGGRRGFVGILRRSRCGRRGGGRRIGMVLFDMGFS